MVKRKIISSAKKLTALAAALLISAQSLPLNGFSDEVSIESANQPVVEIIDIGTRDGSTDTDENTDTEAANNPDNSQEVSEEPDDNISVEASDDAPEAETDEEDEIIIEDDNETTEDVSEEISDEANFSAASFQSIFKDKYFRAFLKEYAGTKAIFEDLTDSSRISEDILEQIRSIENIEIFSDTDTIYETDLSKIESLEGIELFSSLELLDISGTGVSDFDESALPNLKTFILGEISEAKFTDTETSAVYNGTTAFKPSVSVYSGELLLKNNSDYTVSYSFNKNVGIAEVEVSGTGKYKGEKKLYFSIYPGKTSISSVSNKKANQLTVNIASGNPSTVKYFVEYSKNKDMSSATVIQSSIKSVVIKNLDALSTYYIRVYAQYSDGTNILTGEKSSVAAVKVKKDINEFEFTLDNDIYSYSGEDIEPLVTAENLVENTDYTVNYENNLEPGTAKITINGINDYSGSIVKSFTIKPKAVSISSIANKLPGTVSVILDTDNPASVSYTVSYSSKKDFSESKTVTSYSDTIEIKGLSLSTTYYFKACAVKKQTSGDLCSEFSKVKSFKTTEGIKITDAFLSATEYTYDGKAKKPAVSVYSGDVLLEKDTHYTVSYSNNKNAGTATVTVTGIGYYTGSCTLNFLIKAKAPKISSIAAGSSAGGTLVLKLNASKGAVNEISYSTSKDFKKAKKITTSKSEYTISGLKENTVYYVRTRSYVKYGSVKKWTKYSAVVSKKTKISISKAERSVQNKFDYTGSLIKPKPTVTLGGKKLKYTRDYTLSYTNNKSVGKAIVTVKGKGNYAGEFSLAFYIMPCVPAVSSADMKDGTLSVKWTKSKGAVGYSLEYSENADFSSKKTKQITDTSFTVSGLKLGVKYYVRVRAYFTDNGNKVYTAYSSSSLSTLSSSKNYARIAVNGKLYSSASTSSKVLMSLNVGNVVKVLDTSGEMTKVSKDGKTGYILANLYSMGPKFTGELKDKTSLYKKAGNGTVIQTLAKGTKVSVTAISGSYYKVTVDGKTGYVLKSIVKASISDGSSNPQPTATPTPAPVYTGNLHAGSFGVDISEHNGYLDYSLLADKVDFILIRCGYGSDYPSQDDKLFAYNVSQCEKYGIPYGLYLFSYADTIGKAQSEAQHALRLANSCNPTLGVWYDLEWDGMPYNTATVNGIITSFCDTLLSAGYRCGVYTYCMYYKSRFYGSAATNYKIWMAQYNNNNEFASISCAWQFTDSFYISGFSGPFDGNYIYESFLQW